MSPEQPPRRLPTAWEFNKEIVFGEIGSLLGACIAALSAAYLPVTRPLTAEDAPRAAMGHNLQPMPGGLENGQDRERRGRVSPSLP
jgi:hypothetical protein